MDAKALSAKVQTLADKFTEIEAELAATKLELSKLKAGNASLKRRTDARVDRATQKTREWKANYSRTRKLLLEANAEITSLKRSRNEQGTNSL